MSQSLLKTLISELVEEYLNESEQGEKPLTAGKIASHVSRVEYDEFHPSKSESAHMETKAPVASYHNEHSGSAHMHHINGHTVIHHTENKDSKKHGPYDGYHKIKGLASPDTFHKAMKKIFE